MRTAVLSCSPAIASRLLAELTADGDFVASDPAADIVAQLARVVGARAIPTEIERTLAAVEAAGGETVAPGTALAGLEGLADGIDDAESALSRVVERLSPLAARRLEALLDRALDIVRDDGAASVHRERAVRISGHLSYVRSGASLARLLEEDAPGTVHLAAIEALSRMDDPRAGERLLESWPAATPRLRSALLSALAGRSSNARLLLDGVAAGVPSTGELDPATRSRLTTHPDPAVRAHAEELLAGEAASTRAEVIARLTPAVELAGDPAAGRELCARLCLPCHRLEREGEPIGPNLALTASRRREELLVHILDPNRVVDPAYMLYHLVEKDGRTLSGIVESETDASITLRTREGSSTVPRERILELAPTGLSMMPEGLEQELDVERMGDLLAYLVSVQYDIGTSGVSSEEP